MTTKCDANCRKGKACIRVRINDVSKNHQSRAFVIKVGPDLAADPTVFNVAATWSTPVSVKSKINTSKKRKNDPKNEKNSELLAAAGYNNSLDTMQAAMRVSHAAASSEGTSQAPASGLLVLSWLAALKLAKTLRNNLLSQCMGLGGMVVCRVCLQGLLHQCGPQITTTLIYRF